MQISAMLQHLELYSGVGAMRLAVQSVLPENLHCNVTAVDINRVANLVYCYNFQEEPRTFSIEHCAENDVCKTAVHPCSWLWTLSPPCQPYTATANSKQLDVQDHRASSFLHLLQLLPQLPRLPTHILLENVLTFYQSQTHQQLLEVLQQLGYQVFDVACCPSQLGKPHRRPRHYTLAKLVQHKSDNSSSNSCTQLCEGFNAASASKLQQLAHTHGCTHMLVPGGQTMPLQPFLELDWSQHMQPVAKCEPRIQQQVQLYAMPVNRVAKYYKVLDTVTPCSAHSNCFTKGYVKNVLGCGSYVLETDAASQFCQQDERGRLHLAQCPYSVKTDRVAGCTDTMTTHGNYADEAHISTVLHQQEDQIPPALRLRAFTPREVANLQGFPQWFNIQPQGITDRQAYALLGNSLSIDVVSYLAGILLEDVVSTHP